MNKRIKNDKNFSEHSELINNHNVEVNIYSSFEEISSIQVEWDEFVASAGGDIYMSYDWCRIWWKHYGKNRELRIFIFRNNDRLIGVVPVFKEMLTTFLLRIRIAKIVGSDFTLVIVNPSILEKYSKLLYNYINAYMMKAENCDAVYWGHLSGLCHILKTIDNELENPDNNYKLIRKSSSESYTVFTLPDTYDQYLASLSKTTRKHYRQGYKNLSEKYNVCFRFSDNYKLGFDEFLVMHENQWKSVNKLGHFGDWPDAVAFHLDLVQEYNKLNHLRLFCLYTDEKPIVYRYIYQFGKRYYSFLPARVSNSEMDKYGLGQIAHILTVEKAIDEGIREIDTGRGHYNHKLKLGGEEYPVVGYLLCKKSIKSILRVHLLDWFSQMLHFCYYKIWFSRLAPKLPFKRKSLWKLWIRTRL
jgi:CelD/BcsL family acetyltransferase involved in cellulose biosynthesis